MEGDKALLAALLPRLSDVPPARFTIEERIERITDIFATFRNPDKESDFVERNPSLVREYNAGDALGENEIKLFTNDKAGKSGKTFATKREAQNFFAYCRTDFIRYTFLLTDEALTSLAKLVPDIGDYTDENGIIDFTGDINAQLYRLFEIDADMQSIISRTLKEKEARR